METKHGNTRHGKGWLLALAWGQWLRWARAGVRLAFGVTADSRTSLVRDMLERHAKSAPTYWLQLLLAMALATLGLVLGSTGVVIGAMLISPLMGPIVELGMGFAVGSPLLTIRSLARVAASIVGVVSSAALITLALPFQEVTGEIAARTLPTLLDLLVAICCALAAAFTAVRPGSEGAGAAAGTAIGIALVPPLCVVGFGLGTGRAEVAGGAALLFVTNFCAILLFTTLVFLLLAFDRVELQAAEAEHLKRGELTYRAARWLQKVFGSAYGPLLRVVLPLLLVALVSVPLSRALGEVSWQVRARQQVVSLLEELAPAQGTVRSELTVERRKVRVQLVIVGGPERAVQLERRLTERISSGLGVAPTVSVVAVPDMETMRQVARTLGPAPEVAPPPPPVRLAEVGSRTGEALRSAWPAEAAGALLRWHLDLSDPGAPGVEVFHLGPPLGSAGEVLLGRALGERLGTPVRLRDIALRAGWEGSESPPDVQWWLELARALQATSEVDGLHVCVETPPAPPMPASRRAVPASVSREQAAHEEALARLARMAGGHAALVPGTRWNIRLQGEPCLPPPASGAEAATQP